MRRQKATSAWSVMVRSIEPWSVTEETGTQGEPGKGEVR